MKKHIVLIMNIVLIVLIIGAIGFTAFRLMNNGASVEPTEAPTIAPTVSPTAAPTVPPGEKKKIGIIQHTNNTESANCYAGFITELKERGVLEYAEIVYIIEEDGDLCKEKIRNLVDEGCDLLFTIGPFASKAAAAITDEIPIVFAAVSDPEEHGLVESNEEPGKNITGVSSFTPCFEQVDLISFLLPGKKNIGSIYTSTDEYAVRQAIIASKQAENNDLSFERYPVKNKKEIKNALASMEEDKIDVIYLPVDKGVFRNIDLILDYANENKIPVICGNETMLKAGCFATCEINYTSIGRSCGSLIYDILYGGADPGELRVIYKFDCYNLINQETMEKLDIKLNDTRLDQVTVKDYREEATEPTEAE